LPDLPGHRRLIVLRAIYFTAVIFLVGCATAVPEDPEPASYPVKVDSTSVRTIMFEGIHYDITAGTVVGVSNYKNSETLSKEIEWSGHINPNQFNTLMEAVLVRYGYPVDSYKDRLLSPVDRKAENLRVGIVVDDLYSEQRMSARYTNRFHRLRLGANVKILDDAVGQNVFEKRFDVVAVDTAKSKKELLNAYPRAMEKLIMRLLVDPDFLALTRQSTQPQ